MNITLSDRHSELARKHAAAAGFADVGEYLQHRLEQDEDDDAVEQEEVIAAVRESLADIAAGKGRPFEEVFAEIAKKHGIDLPERIEADR